MPRKSAHGIPGLIWQRRRNGRRDAYWRCHWHVIKKGFRPKMQRLWTGTGEPTAEEMAHMTRECERLHHQMKSFSRNPGRRKPGEATGYVYFVSHADTVKIGYTDNLERRLRALAAGSPVKLEFLGSIIARPVEERRLHQRFHDYRIKGEWFRLSDEIKAFLTARNILKTAV